MGGGKSRPRAYIPEEVSPSPMPLKLEEMEEAKTRVRGRKRGRPSTILAGRMMRRRNDTSILKVAMGE